MRECRCWVSRADEETRFVVRYGAHGLRCPAYRKSLDIVDQAHDEQLRRDMETAEAIEYLSNPSEEVRR